MGLDAGCGTGEHTVWLAEAIYPDGHVKGIDIFPDCLAPAQSLACGSCAGVTFDLGDMSDHPFDDGVFDWTWSADALWLQNPLPVIGELARVVRPGGIVAILFWLSQKLLSGYPLLESKLSSTRAANYPYHKDSLPKMHLLRALSWLQEAGLKKSGIHTLWLISRLH